ncbi:MAG: Fic family protein [Mycobacteriales bacterium]
MAGPEWAEDRLRDRRRLISNIEAVGRRISAEAPQRLQPTVAMAQQWHREIYAGTRVPVPCYAGEVRGGDGCPELLDYRVRVGRVVAVSPEDVPTSLERLEDQMGDAIGRVDPHIAVGTVPATNAQISSVLVFAAFAHGEWIRIHPFANGNGRTARLWAQWVAVRYGLPPFVRLKPRPRGTAYGDAAAASMEGRHEVMVPVFQEMLSARLREGARY